MAKSPLTLGILITTMNEGITRVEQELLPQLTEVDEIIVSHQITDKTIKPREDLTSGKVKYFWMSEKGLSKNRNNALHHATADILHICDDDLDYLDGFVETIKSAYRDHPSRGVLTFQRKNETGKHHYRIKQGHYHRYDLLRMSSNGITFRRQTLMDHKIIFDEKFGLGTRYPTAEEGIFLMDCYKSRLGVYHINKAIIFHPIENSTYNYHSEQIIARVQSFKRMLGWIGGLGAIPYFGITHHKYYKEKFTRWQFYKIATRALFTKI